MNEGGYTQVYAGIARSGVVVRLYHSFDYFAHASSARYGEVQVGVSPARNWRLSAYLGALGTVATPRPAVVPVRVDGSLTAARQLGAFNLHAELVGDGSSRGVGNDRSTGRTASSAA